MRLRLAQLRDYLRESLWFIPTLGVLTAIVSSQVVPWLDRGYSHPFSNFFAFDSGPDGARLLLSTIAASTLSLTALVFSVTMLVLQLATSQLSPRVMRTFLRDRKNQLVLALFIGTFAYCLLALRRVRIEADGGVPAATVWLGFALGLLSVGAFVYYIHHMAQSIRASSVIANVASEARAAIERLYPEQFAAEPARPLSPPERAPEHTIRWAGGAGVVARVDPEALAAVAARRDGVIAVLPMVGDFVAHDSPVLSAWARLQDDDLRELTAAISVERERTMHQDAGFGFRQLVDIAERALSPGINDPTTAVQAIDQIHDLLRRLATRTIPAAERVDEHGALRLVLPRPDWEDYVALAVDEIRLYGAGSMQISRRLRYLLEDVRSVAPASRHGPLDRELGLLDAGIREHFALEGDRVTASGSGRQGHGP